MPPGSGNSIHSLGKAMSVLELLAREGRGLALAEIARTLDLNTSTVHHLLATLKERGFVGQDEQTRTYRLGYGLIHLVSNYLAEVDIYAASIEAIRDLRDLSGESAYLTVLENRQSIALIELSGTNPIHVTRPARPGQARLHSTAAGKVLLAYLPWEKAESLLSCLTLGQFTEHTLTSLPQLKTEILAVREREIALDREEDYVGIACVAAPVFARPGQCVATASISFQASHLTNVEPLIQVVRDAARKISANLGYAPFVSPVSHDRAFVPANKHA